MEEEDALCLRHFDSLPDLLALVRKGILYRMMGRRVSPYRRQDKLREQYRRRGLAFRWSMSLRHYGPCPHCDERFTEIAYHLENPAGRQEGTRNLGLRKSHIHAVRVHGRRFTDVQRTFLKGLRQVAEMKE